MKNSQPIGVLDSGLGGLTVVKEIFKQLPYEQIIYVGDTARCPYGPRPKEEIKQFTSEIVNYLMKHHVKSIVIACNTATAHALDLVRDMVDIPVIGVIRPGSIAAIKNTKSGNIGVIGTEGTINSQSYENTLKEIRPDLNIKSIACPTLVPLVEQSERYSQDQIIEVIEQALTPLFDDNIDSLILGCTHYPIISKYIQKVVGENIKLISSAKETAKELNTLLINNDLINSEKIIHKNQFYTTGDKSTFRKMGEKWLETDICVEGINI